MSIEPMAARTYYYGTQLRAAQSREGVPLEMNCAA